MSGWTADQEIEQAVIRKLTAIDGPIAARQMVAGFRAKIRAELQADVLDSLERRLQHLDAKAGAR